MELILSLLKNPIVWVVIALAILSIFIKVPSKKTSYPYVKTKILTKNELNFYKALLPIATKYRLTVFAKIRLADLMNVKKGTGSSEFQSAFNKISQKHADFVLVRSDSFETALVIELDDKSHTKESAQKNDTFKNQAYKAIGLPLLRVTSAEGIEHKLISLIK